MFLLDQCCFCLLPLLFRSVPAFLSSYLLLQASLVAQLVKNLLAVWETWVQYLGWKDPLEKETATTPVFHLGKFHGIHSPWGSKKSDTTEQLSLSPKAPGHAAGQNTLAIRAPHTPPQGPIQR